MSAAVRPDLRTVGLYEHQLDGAEWLAGRNRALLGDVPGLGKTRTIIDALRQAGVDKPVIVCPAIVRSHWQREFDAMGWSSREWSTGPRIFSYDMILRSGDALRDTLIADGAEALVLDESHYVKHADAKRTKILLGKDGYARKLPIVWAASGTPMPKHAAELWPLLSTMFPAVMLGRGIKTYSQWLGRFCIWRPTKFGPKIIGTRNESELREILAECMLRRTLDDVGIEVPRTWWSTTTLDAADILAVRALEQSPETAALKARLAAGEDIADLIDDPHVARLRRMIGEAKAPIAAENLAHELQDGDEKVVVLAHHRSVLAQLRTALHPFGVAYIDGDVPQSKRDAEVDRFQTDPTCRVFVGQTIACQTGITLHAARRVVLKEPDWTGAVNVQAAGRVARIGQTADRCLAQMVALAGTLDEALVRNHHREVNRVAGVLSS